MPLVSLDNTITLSIAVKDRHLSAQWYSDKLGFQLLHHIDEAGWSELQTNTQGVTLGLNEHIEATPCSTIPVFGVSNIRAARESLESAGVEFAGETETIEGMVSTATFNDPDGNTFMLAQDLSGAG